MLVISSGGGVAIKAGEGYWLEEGWICCRATIRVYPCFFISEGGELLGTLMLFHILV